MRALEARQGTRSGQEVGHPYDDDDDGSHHPFHQRQEIQIGPLVSGIVIAIGNGIFGSAMGGHYAILSISFESLFGASFGGPAGHDTATEETIDLAETPGAGNAAKAAIQGRNAGTCRPSGNPTGRWSG